jgi:hypothetical protein
MPESSLPKIGRFQVVKALGRGGQGAVYLAHDPGLDRLVAIKVVGSAPGFSGEEDGSPQARNLAQLRHPNIIALEHMAHPYTGVRARRSAAGRALAGRGRHPPTGPRSVQR